MLAWKRIRTWSGDEQFTLAAAIGLIVGSLAPWLDITPGGIGGGGSYVSGIELNAGALNIVLACVAIWLLNRRGGPRAAAESGAISALALLAGAMILVTVIKYWNAPYSPRWGMYVSGFAAVGMLVGSYIVQGGTEENLPPPD